MLPAMSYRQPATDWLGIARMLAVYFILPGLVLLSLALLLGGTQAKSLPRELLVGVLIVAAPLLGLAISGFVGVQVSRRFRNTWSGWLAFAVAFVVVGLPIYMSVEYIPGGIGHRISQIRAADRD